MRRTVFWIVMVVSTLSVTGQSLVGLSRKEKARAAQKLRPDDSGTTGARVLSGNPGRAVQKEAPGFRQAGGRAFTNKDLAAARGSVSQSWVPDSVAQAAQPKRRTRKAPIRCPAVRDPRFKSGDQSNDTHRRRGCVVAPYWLKPALSRGRSDPAHLHNPRSDVTPSLPPDAGRAVAGLYFQDRHRYSKKSSTLTNSETSTTDPGAALTAKFCSGRNGRAACWTRRLLLERPTALGTESLFLASGTPQWG